MPLSFSSKSETLESLECIINSAKVLPQIRFSVGYWRRQELQVFERIKQKSWEDIPLIVRSSCLSEDSAKSSLAGHFISCPSVKGRSEIRVAIEKVISSFEGSTEDDQVFIQPMLNDVLFSGVAFTRDPNSGGNYFVVNYDDHSGRTDTVTSGHSNNLRTFYLCKENHLGVGHKLFSLILLLNELEELFDSDALDVEFAQNKGGQLYLLQVRPLPCNVQRKLDKKAHKKALLQIGAKFSSLSKPHPYLGGSKTVFGVMPDWNPAEILGVRPRTLSLSLYKDLVTDSIWAYQRDNYGYKNLRSFPLLVSFLGFPYIDSRVSFNSFIPSDINHDLTNRLVNYYIECLLKNPSTHDKVEFEIIFSCYTMDILERLNTLKEFGFSSKDIELLSVSLKALTNRIINNKTGLWKKDIEKIYELERRQLQVHESKLDPISKIYWLLEDCKRYGTLPFAGLARACFIAVQLLKSMIQVGVLNDEDYECFMGSLDTISSQMSQELRALDRKNFLKKYGHLRPGTYDILSPRYDEAPDIYFDQFQSSIILKERNPKEFVLSTDQISQLEKLLTQHKLDHDVVSLLNFIKEAIKGREYGKYIFTKSLSDAMSIITSFAEALGFSRDEISFVDINVFKRLYSSSLDAKSLLQGSIDEGKQNYEIMQQITLPPLITSLNDVYSFELPAGDPNYITLNSIQGRVIFEDTPRKYFHESIIMIPSADPGYDWIFQHGIGGLITEYGGANSHMAIRAWELGIPAVIGAGEVLYKKWSMAKVLLIDCANQCVKIIQ